MSLTDLLFGDDAGSPDDALVHLGERSWTRGEVRDRAEDVAAVLTAAGVETGAAVGVMLGNGVDVIATLFGVWRAGGVYVPLNPRLTDDEVAHVLDSVEPVVVVTTRDRADRFALPVVVADESLTTRNGTGATDRRHDPDVALIQFTSGTTGRPKPVLLLHSGVLTLLDGVISKLRGGAEPSASTDATGGDAPPKPPMPNLIPVSLSLWAGLYNVLFALRVGASVIILDGFDTTQFVTAVRRFGLRSTVLPPAAMTMLADDDAIDDLAPLRFVRSITAPLSPLQARRFKDKFGIAVLNSYGQTEIGGEIVGWNAADSREHGDDKLGSVGRPHAGVTVRAVDDEGNDVGPDDAGELWVMTPALSGGYADGGDLADRLSPDGWFRTGDVGRVDADGFVWIEGRVSSMINRGGLKVHPGEVEEVLRLHPTVADVAVVGAPDDRLGEVPWAFVVLAPGATLDPDALVALSREHLAPYKVPVRVEAIDALPRNEVGKVLARDLVGRIVPDPPTDPIGTA
jgi:acyl-CoA synthetase (AMP-forming)/AMP-acid ligase II